jgi:hypothetical protein
VVDLTSRREVLVGQIGSWRAAAGDVGQKPAETCRVLQPDGWLLTGDAARAITWLFPSLPEKLMWYPAKPGEPLSSR